MRNLSKLLMLCFLSFGIFSCSSDDDNPSQIPDPQTPNLVEAAEAGGLTTLLDAVGAVEGLDQQLLDAEAITVFAPTNQAFTNAMNAYEVETLSELVEAIGGVGNLETVLGFHVVPAVAFSSDLEAGTQTFLTLADQEISVTVANDIVSIEDALGNISTVVEADIEIENGVVHVIDEVLLPILPDAPLPNLVEAAQAAELNVLLDAVGAIEGLDQQLLDAEAITVFAPTDEAFGDLLNEFNVETLDELIAEIGLENLETVLGFHVVPAVAFAEDLPEGENTFTTLADQDITVTRSGDAVSVTDVEGNTYQVTTPNVAIENGVVHVIDGVVLPELASNAPDLVTAANDAGLTTLLAAIDAVDGLEQQLLDAEAITVFAPTNDAFQAALDAFQVETLEELVAEIGGVDNLATVLGFHVIPAVAFAEDIPEGENTFPTLAEQDITVTRNGNEVTVTDTTGATYAVVTADVEIENGVVHVIDDGVLLPALETQDSVAMTVENDGASAYFVSAIEGDENVTTLNENNSTWNLSEGTRYLLNVTGASTHPLALRNSAGDLLITQNGASAIFQDDADVDVQIDGNIISFTLTPDLANAVDNYVCNVHGSMSGSITVN
ncbi:fasciclin domain-containing protein [Psychroflexus planctonicus]|uniref:FAS1 domain-containing protein n=1 Tax=Psychroflexus planctonicus TaxID=1526575 RepID=A0ABQ1SDB5_9FLAO|nr:fasciclin domain-containing protein [Psychroflexus planctonicus]GGE28744.1 hypothetical protein GCM10010832_06720 [Psychroflexus planctonicus]